MATSLKTLTIRQTLLLLSAIIAFTDAATFFDAFAASLEGLFTQQEEAPYTVIKNEPGYEEREYENTTWVCANQTEINKNTARRQQRTFVKLFSYMDDNEMDMTTPVLIEYRHENENESAQVSACFYLDSKHLGSKDLPTPNDETLFIVTKEPMIIFTREIGGFLTKPKEWLAEANSLNETVTKNGEKVRRDLMFWNAFDSPAKLWDRRNEVWLVKEDLQQ